VCVLILFEGLFLSLICENLISFINENLIAEMASSQTYNARIYTHWIHSNDLCISSRFYH